MNEIPTRDPWWWKAGCWAFERMPQPAMELLEAVNTGVHTARNLRVRLERISGTHPQLGTPATVIVGQRTGSVDYFLSRCVGPQPRIEPLGSVPLWQLPRRLAELEESADLIFARVISAAADRWFDDDWLRVPETVACLIDLKQGPSHSVRARRSSQNNARRVRRNGLTWSVSFDVADLERFYHEMYVPFTRKRFGEQGYLRSRHRLRRVFRKGGLMWIEYQGKRISGAVYHLRGDTLQWLAIGTLDGTDAYDDLGALSALYVFGPEYVQQRELRWFDMGGCRSCLTDGVFIHKKRWGGELAPMHRNRHDILVRWRDFNGPAARFLTDIAPLFRRRGRRTCFEALAALPGEVPADGAAAVKLADHLAIPGLERLVITAPGGWSDLSTPLPPTRMPTTRVEPGRPGAMLAAAAR